MFSLQDRVAVITGGASGIGQAIAKLFAQQGATVWIVDRDAIGAESTMKEIALAGARAQFAQLDVTDESAASALTQQISSVDILANIAGIGHVGTIEQTTASDLDRLYAVNVRGTFNLCKAFVPAMLARGAGSVINMASIAGIVGVRDRFAYTTTKFAVVGMTKAMALDHSHRGVRFNAICPGRVETPFVTQRLAEYPDPRQAYREMASTQLQGRMIRPNEVAAAALYLAADESAMVTGSTLMLDGGWSAGK